MAKLDAEFGSYGEQFLQASGVSIADFGLWNSDLTN
jgi:hypothetical protein